jgi:hypothetical protein
MRRRAALTALGCCVAVVLAGQAAQASAPGGPAQDQSVTIHEDTGAYLALDLAAGGSWQGVDVVTGPQHGAVDCGAYAPWTCNYTPDHLYAGADSFQWRMLGPFENSNTATVSIVVTPSVVIPVAPTDDGAMTLGASMMSDPAQLTGAKFVLSPAAEYSPTGVVSTPLGGMPSDGPGFGILTDGDATLADLVPGTGIVSVGDGPTPPAPVRGQHDYDTTVLRLDLDVPADANCLRLDVKFFSEEYPGFTAQPVGDTFLAELDDDTWTTTSTGVVAPDDFATAPDGGVLSPELTGSLALTADNAAGTTYGGATPLLTATTPVTPGQHELYLSVFEWGDPGGYDSAALVDAVRLVHVAEPVAGCRRGAVLGGNSPPTVSAGPDRSGTEGATLSLQGSKADAEDAVRLHWSYSAISGVDPGATCSFSFLHAVRSGFRCTDDGTYRVTLTGSDGVNPPAHDSARVVLANVAPTVGISAPVSGAHGQSVSLTAPIADPGTNDTATCSIGWGDGTTSVGSVTATGCARKHYYQVVGPSTITVTVTDDDGGTATATVAANVPTLTNNLIVNGDGENAVGATGTETVPTPGWTRTVGSTFTAIQYGGPGGNPPLLTDHGPLHRGNNFLAGGSGENREVATQTDSFLGRGAAIDKGRVGFRLSGYFGGFSSQRDRAYLDITWRSATGAALGTARIGPVTAAQRDATTGLWLRSMSGTVPVGARAVDVSLTMLRSDGVYNDGYADNLSLRLVIP